jgi:hypothetical protein
MKPLVSNKFGSIATPRLVSSPRSLSYYFPKNTSYFYGYPAGDNQDFTNLVPPEVEELVAARPFCCVGSDIRVVSFAATSTRFVKPYLRHKLQMSPQLAKQCIILPSAIDTRLQGKERNDAIKAALLATIAPGTLVMAQPFIDQELAGLYQISPRLSYYLNDKRNLADFIAPQFIPERLGEYENGAALAAAIPKFTLPYVIKVSTSSSGDGVYLCYDNKDATRAIQRLADSQAHIIVEQLIDTVKNYGIHFGIPHDTSKPIDIIGVNEQLTTVDGAFLGGVVRSTEIPKVLQTAVTHLQNTVLPKIRALGWYGIGGIDVLISRAGQAYCIDGNFRMTGMSAYHFMINSGQLSAPLISFSGSFKGSERMLEHVINEPLHEDNALRLITLTHHKGIWRFNGALSYTKEHHLAGSITELLDRGIRSEALEQIVS